MGGGTGGRSRAEQSRQGGMGDWGVGRGGRVEGGKAGQVRRKKIGLRSEYDKAGHSKAGYTGLL